MCLSASTVCSTYCPYMHEYIYIICSCCSVELVLLLLLLLLLTIIDCCVTVTSLAVQHARCVAM